MEPPGPRYLFCINPGRSGSQFLATLLATDERVAAFHEAEPRMTGDFLRMVERQSYAETYAARRPKAAACAALLAAAGPGKSVYAETNHMFIKTFFDVVMGELAAAGAAVGVVILRRELARTVKSFAELGIYTARNAAWPDWMPSVEAHTRAIDPAAPEASLTSLERTVAYLVDVEARTQRFLQAYPGANVFATRLEAVGRDPAEMRRLFDWAGLTMSEATLALADQPVNERLRRKAVVGANVPYAECVDAVGSYLERCRRAGVAVPETLALEAPAADGSARR